MMIRNLIKSVIFPTFLQTFDEKLLLERPWLWATRLHRVAWPALLLVIVAVGLGLLVPVATSATLNMITLVSIGIVVAQVALAVYWLYGQDSYHVEREHGVHRDKKGWREYGAYIGAVSMISISLFGFLGIARQHIRTMPANELARDLFLIHLVIEMDDRDNYLYDEMGMDKYEDKYEHHYDYNDNSVEAKAHKKRYDTYNLINRSRATYETRLARAATMFTSNNEAILLDKYIFDQSHSSSQARYQHEESWSSWNEDNYLAEHLDMTDLIPLQAEWANGDYSTLYEVFSRYSGSSFDMIVSTWDEWATYDADATFSDMYVDGYYENPSFTFDEYVRDARGTSRGIINFASNPTVPFMRLFLGIFGAIVIHLSLMRFTFKHSGLKGFLIFAGCVAGVLFLTGIYMFIGEIFNGIVDYSSRFMEGYVMVGLLGGLIITGLSYLRVRSIPTQTKFKWSTAIALYMLPLFLIATPFLLLGVEELATYWWVMDDGYYGGWFSTHFMNNHTYINEMRPIPWSVAPLGLYMLYFSQFAYVPLLGWFKRKHTRLMALPRV